MATIAALALLSGCGGATDDEATTIPLGKIPSTVIQAANKALPEVAFDSATRQKIRGVDTFEIKGKDKKGKAHTIKVGRDGKVISSE